jgi:hypothetical protein
LPVRGARRARALRRGLRGTHAFEAENPEPNMVVRTQRAHAQHS